MQEHKYLASRLDRKTYLKGTFKGQFTGRLDGQKSDAGHELFFDIEVQNGEISTRQDLVTTWTAGAEPKDFAPESKFPVKVPGNVAVSLQYLDGSVKHFMVSLREIKLLRCRLTEQVYYRNEVSGTIYGDVSGYVLHHDTLLEEIHENLPGNLSGQSPSGKKMPDQGTRLTPGPEKTNGKTKPPVVTLPPSQNGVLRVLAFLFSIGLLVTALAIVKSWLPVIVFFLLSWLLIGWARGFRRSSANRNLLSVILFVLLFITAAFFLANYPDKSTPVYKAEQSSRLKKKGELLLKDRQYQPALLVYDSLLQSGDKSADLHYNRALCNLGLGKIQDAVTDLKPGIAGGDTAAVRLHDQINPVKKRTYTVIRCRDGTISRSKNRKGTCSHHGGVKNWAEKVDEEYREFN